MFFCSKRLVSLAVVLFFVFSTQTAAGQDSNETAIALVSSAMDAYSNLEMDKAKELMEQALGMADSLDEQTLAKVHVSYGVLWMGGFSDSQQGEESFVTAICLDPDVRVDPLFSTPDIDMMFNRAKENTTKELCASKGLGPIVLPPCGSYEPITEQKTNYELPFYVEVSRDWSYKVAGVVVHYLYDSASEYNTLELTSRAAGYGAKLDCDVGAILLAKPSTVSYYIEGLDASGTPVCGHGSKKEPFGIVISPDASPVLPIAGLNAHECFECSPTDTECLERQKRAARGIKQEGESCAADMDCAVGLICGDSFYCQPEEGDEEEETDDSVGRGPKKFYVNLTGGSGFGIISKEMNIRRAEFGDEGTDPTRIPDPRDEIMDPYRGAGTGAIVNIDQDAKGTTWNGIPARLAVGVHITPKLSVEVSGRFDAYIVTNVEPVSCWDAAGGNPDEMIELQLQSDGTYLNQNPGKCSLNWANLDPLSFDTLTESDKETLGKHAVARNEDGSTVTTSENQIAWLVNARVRYLLLTKNALRASIFGGVGYGHAHYRVGSKSGSDVYFPLIGMVNIELGPGIAYYFTDNVGLVFEVPITLIVGDGFAVNFDFNLGLGVGF